MRGAVLSSNGDMKRLRVLAACSWLLCGRVHRAGVSYYRNRERPDKGQRFATHQVAILCILDACKARLYILFGSVPGVGAHISKFCLQRSYTDYQRILATPKMLSCSKVCCSQQSVLYFDRAVATVSLSARVASVSRPSFANTPLFAQPLDIDRASLKPDLS